MGLGRAAVRSRGPGHTPRGTRFGWAQVAGNTRQKLLAMHEDFLSQGSKWKELKVEMRASCCCCCIAEACSAGSMVGGLVCPEGVGSGDRKAEGLPV